jgi:hypothetical protein
MTEPNHCELLQQLRNIVRIINSFHPRPHGHSIHQSRISTTHLITKSDLKKISPCKQWFSGWAVIANHCFNHKPCSSPQPNGFGAKAKPDHNWIHAPTLKQIHGDQCWNSADDGALRSTWRCQLMPGEDDRFRSWRQFVTREDKYPVLHPEERSKKKLSKNLNIQPHCKRNGTPWGITSRKPKVN